MFLITSLQYNLSLAFMLIFSQSKQSRISKLSFLSSPHPYTLILFSHFSYPMPVTQNIQGCVRRLCGFVPQLPSCSSTWVQNNLNSLRNIEDMTNHLCKILLSRTNHRRYWWRITIKKKQKTGCQGDNLIKYEINNVRVNRIKIYELQDVRVNSV